MILRCTFCGRVSRYVEVCTSCRHKHNLTKRRSNRVPSKFGKALEKNGNVITKGGDFVQVL